jgi:hypothetical protein
MDVDGEENNNKIVDILIAASEMYYGDERGIEHCAINKEIFLHKPVSTDDLVREINNKISSTYRKQ